MMPDEDLRDTYIKSVLNDVGTVLSGKDLMLLQNTMYAKFEGFTLARTCKELVVDDGNNAACRLSRYKKCLGTRGLKQLLFMRKLLLMMLNMHTKNIVKHSPWVRRQPRHRFL